MQEAMQDVMLELAKQAGLKKEHGSDREYIGDFDWRHFAELIVKDCCKVVDNHYEPIYDGVLIKRYFGVE